MMTDTNNQNGATDVADGGEGEQARVERIEVDRKEYERLQQTLGSMKRELKDLQKSKETAEAPKPHTEDVALVQKFERLSLRQAGITHEEDMELARATAKKWGLDIDQVLADDDFKLKLDRQQTARSNADATSNVKGGSGEGGGAKGTPEYWLAKGTPPTPDQVPDRKVRAKIIRAMMAQGESKGMFYSE